MCNSRIVGSVAVVLLLTGIGFAGGKPIAIQALVMQCNSTTLATSLRTQIDSQCDCASATSRRSYLHCAAIAVRQQLRLLHGGCRSAAHKLVRTTTCGTPGSVVCCNWIRKDGITPSGLCTIQADANECVSFVANHSGQGIACPIPAPSCAECAPPQFSPSFACASPSGAFVEPPAL